MDATRPMVASGGGSLVRRVVRGTEWRQLVDVATPAFFHVLPGKALRGAVRGLVGRWRDHAGFLALRAERAESLAAASIPVRLGGLDQSSDPASARERGEWLLQLYFHQLLVDDRAILDLRAKRFSPVAEGLAWDPKPLWVRWDPGFLGGLREIYGGFYASDDAAFSRGLERLGIDCARETFLEHFGGGDQRAVRFEMAKLTDTFHRTFVKCREAGAVLHADFVPLGLYLAALYEHLETLGGDFDVRGAWEHARETASAVPPT
jgi:hypothetical protein